MTNQIIKLQKEFKNIIEIRPRITETEYIKYLEGIIKLQLKTLRALFG